MADYLVVQLVHDGKVLKGVDIDLDFAMRMYAGPFEIFAKICLEPAIAQVMPVDLDQRAKAMVAK